MVFEERQEDLLAFPGRLGKSRQGIYFYVLILQYVQDKNDNYWKTVHGSMVAWVPLISYHKEIRTGDCTGPNSLL